MKTIMKFRYVTADGMDTNSDILVLIDKGANDSRQEIEDAISSYIDHSEDWQFEQLVCDVLNSFGFDYEVVSPIVFDI